MAEASAAERRVVLSGTVANFSKAFDVELKRYEHTGGSYRGRTGSVHLPAEIANIVQGVFGLDDRPQAKAHFQRRKRAVGIRALTPSTSFTPTQLADLYAFPRDADGTGQCIALIELGGGYQSRDLKTYFNKLNLPHPKVSAVSVDGGHNQPGSDADGEVMLDIEVAGGLAPKSKVVVYFAPNTDQGFLDAIVKAFMTSVTSPPSFPSAGEGPSHNGRTNPCKPDRAFQDAAALGVRSAAQPETTDRRMAWEMACSTWIFRLKSVLACGASRLQGSGRHHFIGNGVERWSRQRQRRRDKRFLRPPELAGGGRFSTQKPGGRIGRGVPDVAGDDPETGISSLWMDKRQ